MFAIYNNGTVGFRSTSDNLYALKNVEELESARFEPKEGLIQNFSNELNQEKKDQFLNSYKKDAGRGIREHHGQFESGDGEHRLRHLRQALFRTGDARGCAARP